MSDAQIEQSPVQEQVADIKPANQTRENLLLIMRGSKDDDKAALLNKIGLDEMSPDEQ